MSSYAHSLACPNYWIRCKTLYQPTPINNDQDDPANRWRLVSQLSVSPPPLLATF